MMRELRRFILELVLAEAQRLLDESRSRALHLEGVAQEIHDHDKACEQIQPLPSMSVEGPNNPWFEQ